MYLGQEVPVDCAASGLTPIVSELFSAVRECSGGVCTVEECCVSERCLSFSIAMVVWGRNGDGTLNF